MSLWPGDQILGDDDKRFTVDRLAAYRGKEGCQSPYCTQLNISKPSASCYGWHCALCDAPCSSHGHSDCPRAGDVGE